MKEVMQDSKEERPNGMLKQNSANLSQMVSSAGFDTYTYIQVSLKDIQETTTKKAALYSKLINILTPLQRMQLKYALEDLSKTSNDQGPPRH